MNKEWIDWIHLNISRGCDKDGIYKILIDEGFSTSVIEKEMGYRPKVDINTLQNPLKTEASTDIDTDRSSLFYRIKSLFSAPISAPSFSGVLPREHVLIPNAEKIDSDLVEMYLLPDFLTKDECEKVTEAIKKKLRPSTIANKDEPDEKFRTSRTCDLGVMGDSFIKDVDQRICKTLGINSTYSEILQGQYYEQSQEFKSHTDYFEGEAFNEFASIEGQRTFTFMVYLNDVHDGGETEFAEISKTIKPQQGMAVIWNNLNKDGSINPNTMHHAHPVKSGYKSIITKWFRSKGEGEMYVKSEAERLPNYTSTGFKKETLNIELFEKIKAFYDEYKKNSEVEIVEGFIHTSQDQQPASRLVNLSERLKQEIHMDLQPLLEDWSNTRLDPTFVYGIRIYARDAILKEHRDREQTHIVSAIINVDQEVATDWPLIIEDHHYRKHRIILNPGEVLFYESARLKHGRPIPLKGQEYANIFCHFKIAGK